MPHHIQRYLNETISILQTLNTQTIEDMVEWLLKIKLQHGRVFFLGVGGSAANCSHAVNDFRKIAGIECYAPTDNVAELTARANDEGWHSIFSEWLKISRLSSNDGVFVLSVGGGDVEKNVSPNLSCALQYAQSVGTSITGIVGRKDGYTAQVANPCLIIPTINPEMITPYTEALQGVICHLLVSHPKLKAHQTKWESLRSPSRPLEHRSL